MMNRYKVHYLILFFLVVGFNILVFYELTHIYNLSESENMKNVQVDKLLKYSVDEIVIKSEKFKDVMYIRGWVTPPYGLTEESKIYVGISSNENQTYYATMMEQRLDVVEFYKDSTYRFSGFSAKINLSEFEKGYYTVVLVISTENNNSVIKTDKFFQISDTVSLEQYKSQKCILDMPIEDNVEIIYNVEEINTKDDKVKIKGWAFLSNEDIRDTRTYILLDDNESVITFDSKHELRNDVEDYYENKGENINLSGFNSVLANDEFQDKEYRIGIGIEKKGVLNIVYTDKYIGGSSNE